MFEQIRLKIAKSLIPHKAAGENVNFLPWLQGGVPIYTDLSMKKATREGYKFSLYVYRSVRTIVQSASGIPWIVLDKNGEEIKNHPFTQTWAHPNPEFSGQDNMEIIIAHLKLGGNSLIQPLMVGGKPREFWVSMPDLIRPVPSKTPGEWLSGYEVTDPQTGKADILPKETFIHLMQSDPGDPYWGIGDLQAAARTVDTDNEAQDTQKIQLQNRNIPPGVFQYETDLTDEQFEEATRRVKEKFLQKSKRGEPWVLGGGYKWQQMALTPVEVDYLASRLRNKQDIATAFGLDPWWLGDRSGSTYNNVIEARRALYELVTIPLLDDIKSTLNLKVAPLYGNNITITYDLSNVAALRDDYGKKVDQAYKLWTMSVPMEQINSLLEMGLEEYPGWDIGYVPFNLMPSGSSGSFNASNDNEPSKMMTKAINLDSEEKKTMHWKRIDRRRVAWWSVLQKRFIPLYKAESEAVEKAVMDNTDAKTAIISLSDDWEKTLKASLSVLVEDFGREIAGDLGGKGANPSERKWTFDPYSLAVQQWIARHAAESITTIQATNLDDVKLIIARGMSENLSSVQIAKEIRKFYDDQSAYKAMRVARTETATAAGYGQHEAARQSGVAKYKFWISSRDERTRDEHLAMDSDSHFQGVPLDEPYPNGMMYPGDPSGGPGNVINCRCVESYSTSAPD